MKFLTNLWNKILNIKTALAIIKEVDEEELENEEEFGSDHSLNNIVGSIHFNLLANNEVYILCDFDTSLNMSENYGSMLYHITSGDIIPSIIAILIQYKQEIPEHEELIDDILKYWYSVKRKQDSGPMIEPSSVFQMPTLQNMKMPDLDDED